MSRIRNANEFLLQSRKISDDYERHFEPHIAAVRKKYVVSPGGKPPSLVDESLEAHCRAYVVNALLAALNWRLDTKPEDRLPNLVPEAPIESLERGTICRLDYLGLERETHRPLLVVETKRPSSSLPKLANLPDSPVAFPGIISQGLNGEPLMREWPKWLATLRDYIGAVHEKANQPPRRVVLTNGKWLILFLDPFDAFLKKGAPNPDSIFVFENRFDIEQRYRELFRYLEHGAVVEETPGLTLGELPFHVAGNAIDRLMHGLRLRYIEQPGVYYERIPVIKVAPVIFLRSRYGAWLRVETPPKDYDLPHDNNELPTHLVAVQKAALLMLDQVNAALGTCLRASPLSKHYEDEEPFSPIRGVVECRKDEFLVVTGDKTHYLLPEPSVPQCPHHDWGRSHTAGVASDPGPIMMRSIAPRSFFISTEGHYCAHRDVTTAKAHQITAENQMRCGLRSGEESDAFCEIWRFEAHLCCRTCAFEDVCTKAEVFHLPCQRLNVGDSARYQPQAPLQSRSLRRRRLK